MIRAIEVSHKAPKHELTPFFPPHSCCFSIIYIYIYISGIGLLRGYLRHGVIFDRKCPVRQSVPTQGLEEMKETAREINEAVALGKETEAGINEASKLSVRQLF